ncbi:putative metalloprotease with PDZ domain [Paucibacter oligotrophus]|uniref:Putative metalloprotease with PDZ domain n=1 Tax=Roseateles oligotrophus TaxID=1769250 RepID=A0A840LDE7_9BURK|nr:PDZ domain-containing protein [Roseateles oligotrophus]MBB4846196.1 putative metalloprotease with PDZ domain [Roseateles oligotrophus]
MALISYRVDLEQPHKHYYQITLTIPTPAAVQELSLPSWIPGSYLLREFARHLSGLRASQGSRELGVEQLDKSRWQVRCSGRSALVLHYRIYAFDNSVRTAFLDAQRGFFNGSSLLLKVHGREAEPQQLSLGELPARWAVATTLPQTAAGEFQAANYDELLDHPFELGEFWQGEFEAGGVRHRFVLSGALPSFDGERLLRDSQKICESQIAMWHGPASKRSERPPFAEYLFMLNAVDEGYGGLEHGASTALIAPRRNLPRQGQAELSDGYVQLLGLISHEYFHAWNVKRLKPAEFARLDYERENYTELLWFFEGFTSYYDDLTLVRCGLIDEARYLKLLATTLSGVLATPGRQVQSLAQASFDAWTKYYRPDENTPNATISYYGKGALLALATDLSLRSAASPGPGAEAPSSLDALMRGLWQRSQGGPISEADILALLADLAGPEMAEELRAWVHGTADLPLPLLLERFGVQWQSDKATVAQRLGLRVNESALAGVQIKQVLAGSLAQEAGLSAGDELLGCNGWRLRRLDDVLLSLAATQTRLEFLLARDQRLLSIGLDLPATGGLQAAATGAAVLLSPAEKPALRVSHLRRAWLAG